MIKITKIILAILFFANALLWTINLHNNDINTKLNKINKVDLIITILWWINSIVATINIFID